MTRALCRDEKSRLGPPRTKGLWGKADGPPGLGQAPVEAFLCEHQTELAAACWSDAFSGWDHGDVEYGLVVDPSGAVLSDPDNPNPVVAEVARGAERRSSPALSRCVEQVVSRWRFPRATMPTWMTLAFRLPE
ncbi:MAG TPA: hypothetical protein VHE30_14475 [Polyangiaceae bacterium]|nr:hypothetical protein [Polyangiaceae bacterium]